LKENKYKECLPNYYKNGQLVYNFEYWPYGEEFTSSEYNWDSYRYTGHQRDYDLGLDYMRSRHYSYTLGRFYQPDSVNGSIGSAMSWNLYSYVQGNPMNLTDPTGTMERWQGLGKALDPYLLLENHNPFPIAVGWMSPAEMSAYYTIALTVELEAAYKNYESKYSEAVNQFIELILNQIKNKGDIYKILYEIFEKSGFGMVAKEVLTQILEYENRYIKYGTKECLGTECSFGVIHPSAIALAHTHPVKGLSGEKISEKPSEAQFKNGKWIGDAYVAKQKGLPNIVVSREAIWVVMPNTNIYNILTGEWWK
jgi:RHS repeat-associated protein